ncbi:MAG: tRNA (cytidine(34)-2'-O)-methyltransferase [Dokdonia sp.]|jgi:tRNA (cytidine/uridine-2'-O-)-methyltransferase|nr:tRNA (uridine(34)/cytosine(34)/5-carboxymethylaminomethyluridine(34)-2'-O)-methyltransferase TrmL [Cytophagaceae bacterium]|tara:strand:- start:331 stop:783 length:453 start_codon:yes stop_codon:yes gene_type:complete
MAFNIVLVAPEIPNNTGNIGRLCLGTNSELHLIKPLGFEINDSRLKRAGLDYWQHLKVNYYDSWEAFLALHSDKKMAFFSSHGQNSFWEIPFSKDMFLIFGKESTGLPAAITSAHKEQLYQIPLYSPHIRSLNLANAVGITIYEGLRQLT